MILVAGLTPAWQQIITVEKLALGQVNRARQVEWCGSGKVLNVGFALKQINAAAKTVCLIGGATGQQIRSEVEENSIDVRWVESAIPSRVCTTIVDENSHTTTELVENSNPISEFDQKLFLQVFSEESIAASLVVLTGSLPSGTPSDFYRRMLGRTTAKSILDIRGPELDAALLQKPFLVKPNREELAKTVGRPLENDDELVAAMAEIRSRGAEWVVVSSGPGLLYALGPEGLIQVQPPQVDVCNPIGCGDCLAAGIAAGIDRGLPMQQALEIGVRAAAENARELLPARKLTPLPPK